MKTRGVVGTGEAWGEAGRVSRESTSGADQADA